MISYITKELCLSILVLILLSKMGWQNERTDTSLDVVRTLLLESSVPSKFWVEAKLTSKNKRQVCG
jgi:hypothetical protein